MHGFFARLAIFRSQCAEIRRDNGAKFHGVGRFEIEFDIFVKYVLFSVFTEKIMCSGPPRYRSLRMDVIRPSTRKFVIIVEQNSLRGFGAGS